MSYLNKLHPKEADQALASLRLFAQQENIPIIEEDTARFIKQLLSIMQPTTILEIGSAIGYTATLMAKAAPKAHITTIERDATMIELVDKHLSGQTVSERITVIQADALKLSLEALPHAMYDVIFIDAAKAQNINFFEKYEGLLRRGGIILVDNILFHGMVEQEGLSKNLTQLMRKVDRFNRYVLEREDFDTALYHIGDGLCMSIKK